MLMWNEEYRRLFLGGSKAALDLITAGLDASERVGEHQLRTIRDYRKALGHRADEANRAASVDGLRTLQANWLQQACFDVTDYWTGLFHVACQNQWDLARRGQWVASAWLQPCPDGKHRVAAH